MIISNIDKDYTKSEAIAADAYVAVDSASKGTGKMKVSELGDTVMLEYGDDSTYDDVLAMLNAGKRVLVSVDPFFSNNNAIGSDGVQKYPISPYKVLLQANVPTGNPYIDFTGYTGGSVVQVSHVALWSSAPSMPTKINNWCVNDVNPTELAKMSDLNTLSSRVDSLEASGGGSSGGYGSDWFIVNFSLDSNNNLVADKTHYEIKQWYEANGMMSFNLIKGVYMGRLFTTIGSPGDHQTPWTFECPIVSVANGTPILNYATITLPNTNEASFTVQEYTLQTSQE